MKIWLTHGSTDRLRWLAHGGFGMGLLLFAAGCAGTAAWLPTPDAAPSFSDASPTVAVTAPALPNVSTKLTFIEFFAIH